MTIVLHHTIIPARDKQASAEFFARIFGLELESSGGRFAVVRVSDTLTFDFGNWEGFEPHHYAFHVSDAEFDAIFARVKEAGLEYSSDPMHFNKGQINSRDRRGGRSVYFYDPNGHNLELLTRA